MSELDSSFGIVRHRRWIAWRYHGGLMLRPQWLANAVVTSWNWLSCHLLGHEWEPDIEWPAGAKEPRVRESHELCPHCSAERTTGP